MINHDVVESIKDSVGILLSNYSKEIDTATADEGSVKVSMPIKIKQTGSKLDVEVGIGFVKEKVRDAVAFVVDGQKELFLDNGVSISGVGDEA